LGSEGLSYLSYPPESIPEADSIEVFNRATGQLTGGPMADGGLDPLPIPSSVGDTLDINILGGGSSLLLDMKVVPPESPPRVVRTRPKRRQLRVPLNSSLIVIFSEPISATTANNQNIQLLDGSNLVPSTLVRLSDGIRIEIIPEAPLRSSTTYFLSIGSGIRDLSGEALQEPYLIDFMTVTAGAPLSNQIVFESKRSGRSEIWYMNADGSDPVQLTREVAGGVSTGPALSPDGRQVVFSVWPLGEEWEIYAVNVDGTGLRNLTNHPAFDGWRPAWSPDGGKISFFSTRDDPANDEIYVMNADGTDVRRLTNNPADDAMSTWAPDGTKIAFETNRRGNFDIFLMNPDGTDPVPITTHPAEDGWPAWSPDGTKIAFESWRDGNPEIYVMNPDGSNVVRLTYHGAFDGRPAWSRDGTKIAFESGRGGSSNIWVMNADGTDVVRLTKHWRGDFFPNWSP
jgi:Tol biopolymer transport system component